MTKQKIIKGNKLIAEFMYPNLDEEIKLGEIETNGAPDLWVKGILYYKDYSRLEYHTNWNWLMQVVDKIEHLYEDETSSPIFDINSHYSKFTVGYPQHKFKQWIIGAYLTSPEKIKADSKIEATWMVVVEFIKWYNKHK